MKIFIKAKKGELSMYKMSNSCGLLFCLSVLFLLLLISTLPSYAQPRKVGSALPPDTPRTPSPSPSYDYSYPTRAESYTPTPQDMCGYFRGSQNLQGCYVECKSYSQGKCTLMFVNLSYLLPYEKMPVSPQLTFERKSGESDLDFFQRYNSEIFDQLLKAGISVNSPQAQSALLSAVANGQSEIARKLINAGTKIDPDEGGRVLLAAYDKTAILQLIKLGAYVNAKVRNEVEGQRTPLSNAVSGDIDLEVIQSLLTAGANPNESLKDSYGSTSPFLMALEKNDSNRIALIKMFLAAGAKVNDAKLTRNDYPYLTKVEFALMLAGCDNTDSPELIKILLEAGADPRRDFRDVFDKKYVSIINDFKDRTCPYKKQVIALLKQAKSK